MVKVYSKSICTQLLENETKKFPKRIYDAKLKPKAISLDLLLSNLINKFHITKFFLLFIKQCPSCKRKFSEIFIDYYITKKIKCNKCKFKTKFFTTLISIVLNVISSSLNMPKEGFREILRNSESLKRLALSYIEGCGLYGFKMPTIPIGPPVVFWSVTQRCNLNCTHCFVDQDLQEMSFDEACTIIDQLSEAKNYILTFFGGEVLLRNDIFDLMRYASKKKINVAYGSILLAMLLPEMTDMILPGIIRMSFGIENNEKEVKHFIQILKQISNKPRTLGQKTVARFHNGVLFSRKTKTQFKIEKSIEKLIKKVFFFPNLD